MPEASLIDIRRISKDCQKKWQAKINYSKLFDLKESYRYPETYCKFSCQKADIYTLTCDMGISKETNSKCFLCACPAYHHRYHSIGDYASINNDTMLTNIRPVFKYSAIKEYSEVVEELAPGYLLVTFGEYPNKMVYDSHMKDVYIGSCFWEHPEPIPTGNKYILIDYKNKEKEIKEYSEVTYNGIEGKYVIKDDKIYKVEPIYFLVDVKKDFAISRDVLFTLPTLKDARKVASYKETFPYEFLNTYFVSELMQNIIRQKEQDVIETNEIPEIKSLIDSIIKASENSVLEETIKKELQVLINEYNTCIDNEKETDDSDITLGLTELSSDELFINKFKALLSKITDYPYYSDSKIIYECLNLNEKDNKEIASELYKDLTVIYKIILPSLPENICLLYKERIRKILEDAKNILIVSYKTQTKTKMNIELIVREKLQPILEDLYNDVTKNYILINLEDIINGIFKSSNDQYLSYLFELINAEVKNIEILISLTKKEEYSQELNEILKIDNDNYTFNYLIEIYLKILKLKEKLEKIDIKRTAFERKKIRRRII